MDNDRSGIVKQGDIRKGVVISVSPESILVDIGNESAGEILGAVSGPEVKRLAANASVVYSVGDETLVYIVATKGTDGTIVLSLEQAQREKVWHTAQELLESQAIFEGIVTAWNRGGLLVDFNGINGFVPISKAKDFLWRTGGGNIEDRLARMVGKVLPLKVLEVDRKRNRLVLSTEGTEHKWRQQRKKQLMATLREGDIVEGDVQNLTEYGAFVDLGGARGLIHLSELTWGHAVHPSEVLQVGERVSVYVLAVDQEKERIALSIKRLRPDPWSLVKEKYVVGQLVEGEITRLTDFGAFVQVEEGVEGLIHTSEMSESPPKHPRQLVEVGDIVLLKVVSIDAGRRRISLSMKQVDPFDLIEWQRERQQALVQVEEPIPIIEERQEKPDVQTVVVSRFPETRPEAVTGEPLSMSDQIVQEMEEVLILDATVNMSALLEADLDQCRLEPPGNLGFDYSQLSEQLSAELYAKSLDKKLDWRVQASLSLQAAAVLHRLGYSLSNRQMREYLCTYCRIQGNGYFAEKQYDPAHTYYREALRLLPTETPFEEKQASDLVLRFLKTFIHPYTALMQAIDIRSLFLAATTSRQPELIDGVALSLIDLASTSFSYIKQTLGAGRLEPGTERGFFEKLVQSLQRILAQNGQETAADTELMTLLQKAVTCKNYLSDELELLLNGLIGNSYELNHLHLLESTFTEIHSIGPLVFCPTDREMVESAYQIYEDLIKYIAQERFVDKEVYRDQIVGQIRKVRGAIQRSPTQYGKALLDELLTTWMAILSVEFRLEAILTGSEYLDRVSRLEQVFGELVGLKEAIYDPVDREVVDHLQSIYQNLLHYSSCESARDKIYAHEQLGRQLETARELVLAKRTYLGVQYFIAVLAQWQNILENDHQSFLTRTVRDQKGVGRKWTLSDEELLRANYEAASDLELAAYLGRTETAIAAKMRQLKLMRKRGRLAQEEKEYWQNPYIVGPPIKNKDMFFGRQDIFDYIQANLIGPYQHNTIVLHGRRRTGKSSILYQIQRRDLLHPCITVLIDTQGLGRLTMPLLFYKMSSHVSKALQMNDITIPPLPEPQLGKDPFWRDPFWRFVEFLDNVEHATNGQKLILMIDEFEKIQDEIKHGHLDIDLYDNFRHLIQHREDIGFILAGTMRMVDIVKDYTSPFFGSSLLRRVSFLEEDEAIALIRKPIEERIRYDDQSVERILALTGGHPFFIQLICQTLVNHLTYLKKDIVNLKDVEYVLGDTLSTGEGQFIFEWTSDTSSLDRLVLAWLADHIKNVGGERSTTEIEGMLSRLLTQPRFAETSVLRTLDDLTGNEVLSVRQGEASFRVDLYRQWIRQNKDLTRVCKEEKVDQSLLE